MELPSFESYGDYSSKGYGADALVFTINGARFWYSYRTLVAFAVPGCPPTVRENSWGPTTGKHLGWIERAHGVDRRARLPAAAFRAAFRAAFGEEVQA